MSKQNDIAQEWRLAHKDELDKTLAVLISIRDDEGETAKSRIDAGRAIARMLGAMSPEKEEVKPKEKTMRTATERGLDELFDKMGL